MFFNFFQKIKVNLLGKIMQSAYLCVIFRVKHKKLPSGVPQGTILGPISFIMYVKGIFTDDSSTVKLYATTL